jgi:vitamin B12 transporter
MAYGSYQTLKLDAGVDGSLKKLQYNLQYGYTNSKGFSCAYDSTSSAGFERDKFSQHSVQASLGYRVSQKNTIKISSNFGQYLTGLDAAPFADDADYTNKNTSFINSFTFTHKGKKGTWNFLNSYISTKRQLMDDSASVGGFSAFTRGHYSGNSLVNELYGNISLSKKLSLLTGLQRIQSSTSQSYYSISSWGPYETALGDSAKTTNYAAYASVSLLQYHRFNAEAGIRMNHHSIYGNNMTWSFNPSYNINAHTRIFVNLSSAYRVPSLYQLYSEYGNKDLQPEKSNNYEIGIQSSLGKTKNMLRLVAFKRDIKQVIIFYTDVNTYESKYLNKDLQHDYGFELESSISIGKTGKWVTNLTYVDGEGKTDDVKIKNLYRRPNFTANSSISLEPKKGWMLMPSVRFVGKRLKGEYDIGPAEMHQYCTVDFFSSYQMSKCFRVFADWRNISNQRYFDIPGYNCRLANMTIGIRAVL